MKVIDLEFYRRKKEIALLETKMSDLAQRHGTAREMKLCFREWLKRTGSLQ